MKSVFICSSIADWSAGRPRYAMGINRYNIHEIEEEIGSLSTI